MSPPRCPTALRGPAPSGTAAARREALHHFFAAGLLSFAGAAAFASFAAGAPFAGAAGAAAAGAAAPAAGAPAAGAAKRATTTVPIVMTNAADPVGTGLVASLARPGGNITGLTQPPDDLAGKQLELLKRVVPRLDRVALLRNPANSSTQLKVMTATAAAMKLRVLEVTASSPAELDSAFARIRAEKIQAVLATADPLVAGQGRRIASLAKEAGVAAISQYSEHAELGLLMSYGPDVFDYQRRGAMYVDKILKGSKPAELPVEMAKQVSFVVNRGTAKAIGINIPQSLLLRADRVIE